MTERHVQIDFLNLDRSEALEAEVRRHIEKLASIYNRIQSCCVTIERPHANQRHGQLFQVRIDVKVPGHELVASRSPDQAHQHEDARVAVRDAFDAIRRQLDETVHQE